jgi:adenylate kinase
MRLVLLGYPGVGKGTQAESISKSFKIPHISTGNILRDEIKKSTYLGRKVENLVKKGNLVSDEIIIELIKNEISKHKSSNGFVMDGFPRNLKQAKMFQDMLGMLDLKLDKVVNIFVEKDEIIRRLSSRMICGSCNSVYSIDDLKNMPDMKCSICGGKLYKRKDDEKNIIEKRLEVYETETRPLIDYYSKQNLLIDVDGNGSEDEVTERVLSKL